jgi:hypothetical protein
MGKQNIYLNYVINNIGQLDHVKDLTLVRGYHQIFEQYHGLHPDGFDDMDSGWPEELKPICAEMWRRVESLASSVKPDQMYYINKAFRKLVAESANGMIVRKTGPSQSNIYA